MRTSVKMTWVLLAFCEVAQGDHEEVTPIPNPYTLCSISALAQFILYVDKGGLKRHSFLNQPSRCESFFGNNSNIYYN